MTLSAVDGLAQATAGYLTGVPAASRFMAEFPRVIPSRAPAPSRLPVCRVLPKLGSLAGPSTRGLVDALASAADALSWRQTYSASDFGPEFLENYGWTELIGLRGPIASEKLACGFLLLGANAEYPAHAHEAEELYLPLAGEALWMRGDEGFVRRDVGEPIEHPAWTPHAMCTSRDPVLALYLWRGGDLAAKSRIVGKP